MLFIYACVIPHNFCLVIFFLVNRSFVCWFVCLCAYCSFHWKLTCWKPLTEGCRWRKIEHNFFVAMELKNLLQTCYVVFWLAFPSKLITSHQDGLARMIKPVVVYSRSSSIHRWLFWSPQKPRWVFYMFGSFDSKFTFSCAQSMRGGPAITSKWRSALDKNKT